jgi:threonine dehydratase
MGREESMNAPTLNDIYLARERIAPHLPRTPLLRHPLLDQATGLSIWVKHENHNPTCAFKVRGGLNLVGAMSPEERSRGIVTASTGNHGQSIGMASRIHGVACTVFVPAGNNPDKNAAMRAYGATLEEGGRDFDQARERCEQRAAATGARYVHSANEPLLLAGVGTYALELFEALPAVDVIFVPIGGGSGACGLITVRNALGARAKIIGVSAANADAVYRSWKGPQRVVGDSADTFAEGLATRVTFDLTFGILKQHLDDFMVLTEAELADGVRLALRMTHNLAEGAGAAALAAAYKRRADLVGQRVACVMSGGNIDQAKLNSVLESAFAEVPANK